MTEDQRPKIRSVIYQYSVDLYDQLVNKAKYVEPAELARYGWSDTSELVLVYYGNVATVADQLGLSRNIRTKAASLLAAMKCIIKLQGGGGHSTSVYALLRPPTEERYLTYRASLSTITASLHPTERQLIIRDLRELQRRVGRIEQLLAEDEKGRPDGHHL